jgi:FHS family L-fucose permease-like MFS transporter
MLIFAACLAIFVYGMVASMLGTITPGLAVRFGLANAQSGYLALAQGLGLVVASVSVGPLMDRRGKKAGLLLGLLFVAGGLLGLANATGYPVIVASMVLLGMGGGIVITGANALGSDVSESRRATVLNFLNVFVGLGGLATPFVAGNLLGSNPVRVAYAAAFLTIATLLVTLVLDVPAPVRAVAARGGSADVFRRPILYLLASITFLYTACEFGIWNWLPKYLISRGMAEPVALNILSLGFALGLLLGRVAVLPILVKVPALTVTVTAAILMAVTTFLFLHLANVTAVAVTVFIAGLAMAPVFPTTVSIVGDLFKRGSATAIGFTITCGFSGLVVSSPLIGLIAGDRPDGLSRGLLVLPVFSVLLLGANLLLRANYRASHAEAANLAAAQAASKKLA